MLGNMSLTGSLSQCWWNWTSFNYIRKHVYITVLHGKIFFSNNHAIPSFSCQSLWNSPAISLLLSRRWWLTTQYLQDWEQSPDVILSITSLEKIQGKSRGQSPQLIPHTQAGIQKTSLLQLHNVQIVFLIPVLPWQTNSFLVSVIFSR